MVEIILYILAGILLGLALPVLFMRSRNSRNDVSVRLDAMDKLYREMLKKRQSSDFRYSEEVRKVIDRVHAEKNVKVTPPLSAIQTGVCYYLLERANLIQRPL